MRMASLIFNWKLVEVESKILKQSSEQSKGVVNICLISNRILYLSLEQPAPQHQVTMEREENHKLPFLDVLLDNHSNQGIITSVFHRKPDLHWSSH